MPLRIVLSGLFLLAALGLGLVGYQVTRPPKTVSVATVPEVPPPLTVDVLVAAHSLPAGTLMKDEDFTKKAVPSVDVPKGAMTDSPDIRAGLHGALLRHYLDAGNILMTGDVLNPRDRGFLAAVLGPDMRAVSVGVDAVSGTAGLIWPGDRVDVVLTQQLSDDNLPAYRRVAGETVLPDIRVIAIDQALMQGAMGDGPEGNRQVRTVTLEVTPKQAERVAVATRLGRLALVVRSASGAEAPLDAAATITWGGDVSPALRAGRGTAEAPPQTLQIFQGAAKREEFRF